MRNRRSLFIKVSLVAGFLLAIFLTFSYWYMIKCEGQWTGIPLERQGNVNLGKIRYATPEMCRMDKEKMGISGLHCEKPYVFYPGEGL